MSRIVQTVSSRCGAPISKRIVERLRPLVATGARVLDVGCAHGWFLDAAREAGFETHGIEPDAAVAEAPLRRGHRVTIGFFPDQLDRKDRYDVIVFNDAFEHFTDPHSTLVAAAEHLAPQGLVVINLPSAEGPYYRVAEQLDRLGRHASLDRMWQVAFASPHITYFTPSQLEALGKRVELEVVFAEPLPSVTIDGLWSRIRYDRSSSLLRSAATWLGVALTLPAVRMLPPDIIVMAFRRGPGQAQQ